MVKSQISIMFKNTFPKEKVKLFLNALLAIAKIADSLASRYLNVNIVFLDSPNLKILFDEDFEGVYSPTIFFPIYKWKESGYNDECVQRIMKEKLTHAFCQFPNEEELEEIADGIL